MPFSMLCCIRECCIRECFTRDFLTCPQPCGLDSRPEKRAAPLLSKPVHVYVAVLTAVPTVYFVLWHQTDLRMTHDMATAFTTTA